MADTAGQIQELVVQYPELRDAVRMAMVDALRANKNGNEWGGAIFQRGDNRFYATKPQSSEAGKDLKITARADQVGDHAVAIYHTHPNTRTAGHFSRADTDFAKAFGRPSFLGSDFGDVRVFDPKIDRADYVSPDKQRDDSVGGADGRTFIARAMLANALRQTTTPQVANN
jgi:proteasome lid subunit RPN8/RPN11